MKKIFVTSILLLISSYTVQAQKLKYGLKVGVSLSNLRGNNGIVEDASSIVTPQFGGFVYWKLSDKMSFKPELLYSKQGAKLKGEIRENELSASYLNIPLMFQRHISKRMALEFGPQLGILLKFKYKIYRDIEGDIVGVESQHTDGRNSIDFGLNLGGVYQLENGLNLYLRYNFGLISLAEGENLDSPSDTWSYPNIFYIDGKHSVLSFGVGYFLK